MAVEMLGGSKERPVLSRYSFREPVYEREVGKSDLSKYVDGDGEFVGGGDVAVRMLVFHDVCKYGENYLYQTLEALQRYGVDVNRLCAFCPTAPLQADGDRHYFSYDSLSVCDNTDYSIDEKLDERVRESVVGKRRDLPLVVTGGSDGGLLALKYAIEENAELLFLRHSSPMSPCVDVDLSFSKRTTDKPLRILVINGEMDTYFPPRVVYNELEELSARFQQIEVVFLVQKGIGARTSEKDLPPLAVQLVRQPFHLARDGVQNLDLPDWFTIAYANEKYIRHPMAQLNKDHSEHDDSENHLVPSCILQRQFALTGYLWQEVPVHDASLTGSSQYPPAKNAADIAHPDVCFSGPSSRCNLLWFEGPEENDQSNWLPYRLKMLEKQGIDLKYLNGFAQTTPDKAVSKMSDRQDTFVVGVEGCCQYALQTAANVGAKYLFLFAAVPGFTRQFSRERAKDRRRSQRSGHYASRRAWPPTKVIFLHADRWNPITPCYEECMELVRSNSDLFDVDSSEFLVMEVPGKTLREKDFYPLSSVMIDQCKVLKSQQAEQASVSSSIWGRLASVGSFNDYTHSPTDCRIILLPEKFKKFGHLWNDKQRGLPQDAYSDLALSSTPESYDLAGLNPDGLKAQILWFHGKNCDGAFIRTCDSLKAYGVDISRLDIVSPHAPVRVGNGLRPFQQERMWFRYLEDHHVVDELGNSTNRKKGVFVDELKESCSAVRESFTKRLPLVVGGSSNGGLMAIQLGAELGAEYIFLKRCHPDVSVFDIEEVRARRPDNCGKTQIVVVNGGADDYFLPKPSVESLDRLAHEYPDIFHPAVLLVRDGQEHSSDGHDNAVLADILKREPFNLALNKKEVDRAGWVQLANGLPSIDCNKQERQKVEDLFGKEYEGRVYFHS